MDAICFLQSLGYISPPEEDTAEDNPYYEPWLEELLVAGMAYAQVVEAVIADEIVKN